MGEEYKWNHQPAPYSGESLSAPASQRTPSSRPVMTGPPGAQPPSRLPTSAAHLVVPRLPPPVDLWIQLPAQYALVSTPSLSNLSCSSYKSPVCWRWPPVPSSTQMSVLSSSPTSLECALDSFGHLKQRPDKTGFLTPSTCPSWSSGD